jgi:hypothetical protein
MPMAGIKYKTIEELAVMHKNNASGLPLFNETLSKLAEHGFAIDMSTLSGFLKDNPLFLSYCEKIDESLKEHNTILVVVDDPTLIWSLHKYFTILYSLNNAKGESIYRISLKHLIDCLLERDTSPELPTKLNKNLIMISNILAGDNRISSMAPSIEGILDPLIFNRKVIFTAHSVRTIKSKIREDIMYKLRNFYSPTFEQTFQLKVAPVIIQTGISKKSLWED